MDIREILALREDSIKYDILVNYLLEIIKDSTTYDIKEKIEQILRVLGEK